MPMSLTKKRSEPFEANVKESLFIGIAHVWFQTYPEALGSKLQTFHDSIVSQLQIDLSPTKAKPNVEKCPGSLGVMLKF